MRRERDTADDRERDRGNRDTSRRRETVHRTTRRESSAQSRNGRGGRRGSQSVQSDGDTGEESTLTVGEQDSAFEREARKVAAQVTGGLGAGVDGVSGGSPRVQRSTSDNTGGDTGGRAAPQSVHEVISSPGKSPDSDVVRRMGEKMNEDFSSVSVHTGPRAAKSARDVDARAYTVGEDIVFDSGEYAPDAPGGRQVLAHELTHVAQQSRGEPTVQRSKIKIGEFGERLYKLANSGQLDEIAKILQNNEISHRTAELLANALEPGQQIYVLKNILVEKNEENNTIDIINRKVRKKIGVEKHNSLLKRLGRTASGKLGKNGNKIIKEKKREVGEAAVDEYRHGNTYDQYSDDDPRKDLLNHTENLEKVIQKGGEREGERFVYEHLASLAEVTYSDLLVHGLLSQSLYAFTSQTERGRKNELDKIAEKLKPSYEMRREFLDSALEEEDEHGETGRKKAGKEGVRAVVQSAGQAFHTVTKAVEDLPKDNYSSISAKVAIRPKPDIPLSIKMDGSFQVEHDSDGTWKVEAEVGLGAEFDAKGATAGGKGSKHVTGQGSTLDAAMLGVSYAAYREYLGDSSWNWGSRILKDILTLGANEALPSVADLIWGAGQTGGEGGKESYAVRAQRWAAAAEKVLAEDQPRMDELTGESGKKRSGGSHGGALEGHAAVGVEAPGNKSAFRASLGGFARWKTTHTNDTQSIWEELGDEYAGRKIDATTAAERRRQMRTARSGLEEFQLGASATMAAGIGSYGTNGGLSVAYTFSWDGSKRRGESAEINNSLKVSFSVGGKTVMGVQAIVDTLLGYAENTKTRAKAQAPTVGMAPGLTQSGQSAAAKDSILDAAANEKVPIKSYDGHPDKLTSAEAGKTGKPQDLAAGATKVIETDSESTYTFTLVLNSHKKNTFSISTSKSTSVTVEAGFVFVDVEHERGRKLYTTSW